MPYEVLQPEVFVLEKIGEIKDKDGDVIAYEHRSVLYRQGDVVADDVISPVIVEAYDAGETHATATFARVEEEVKSTTRGRPKKEPSE